MPDRPPNCRTAEIACTLSEMHALAPKLDGKGVVPEIMEVLRNVVRQSRKKLENLGIFWHLEVTILTGAKT